MNVYYLTAGILAIITGFIHAFLGEKWLFERLTPEQLETHYTGAVTKTTLRWFWHVGSFIVLFVGVVALLLACSHVLHAKREIGLLLGIIYLGINAPLLALTSKDLKQLKEYPQLIIMLGIMVLLFLGSKASAL